MRVHGNTALPIYYRNDYQQCSYMRNSILVLRMELFQNESLQEYNEILFVSTVFHRDCLYDFAHLSSPIYGQ